MMSKQAVINEKALKHISVYIKMKLLLSLWYLRSIVEDISSLKVKSVSGEQARKKYNASETGTKDEYIYCQAVIQSINDIDELITFFNDEIIENKELHLLGFVKRAVRIIKSDMVNKNAANNHFLRLHEIIKKTTLRPIMDQYYNQYHPKSFLWISQNIHFKEVKEFFYKEWIETAHYGEQAKKCLKVIFENTSVYDVNHVKARDYLIKSYQEEIKKEDSIRHLDKYIEKVGIYQSNEILDTIIKTAVRLCRKDMSPVINDEIRRLYVLLSPTDTEGIALLTKSIIYKERVYFKQG